MSNSQTTQESKTTNQNATPEDLRCVLACAMAWKKYSDSIERKDDGERDAFMRGFVAGVEYAK